MMVHRQCQSSGLVSQHQHDFKTLKVLEIWSESWLDSLAVSWCCWCCANGAHSTAFGHWTEVIARRLCTWPLKWSHLSYVSVANLATAVAAHCQDFFQAHCLWSSSEFGLPSTAYHYWTLMDVVVQYQSDGDLGHSALARHSSCLARAAANWFRSHSPKASHFRFSRHQQTTAVLNARKKDASWRAYGSRPRQVAVPVNS